MAAHQAPSSLGFSRQEHWSGLPFPPSMHENEKWKWSHSVVSDWQRPHGLQPTRLLRPWDFPGKSTGVGCHCLLLWEGHQFLNIHIKLWHPSLIPGLGRFPGEGIGYSLQYSWISLMAQMVKNQPATRETWVWSLGWDNPLEEGMAAHSSILARIPWKEEPGRLQPMESQRIVLEWVTKHSTAHLIFTIITYKRESIILTLRICLQCRRQVLNLSVKKIHWRRKW